MGTKQKRLDSFFTRNVLPRGEEKNTTSSSLPVGNPQAPPEDGNPLPSSMAKSPTPFSTVKNPTFCSIEHDPGLHLPIWKYAANMKDEIRRAYLRSGHINLCCLNILHLVQKVIHDVFRLNESNTHNGHDAFTTNGFKNWNKVKGKHYSFLKHNGDIPNSQHYNVVRFCDTLMNQSGISFRGHDEKIDSNNRGNFIELIKHTTSYNEEVAGVVLENAPGNAKYTSPEIVEDICDAKYCIIVDEASDESKKEQMAIVLRYVDKKGNIQEQLFDLVHLVVENLRGQGYDGASNMCGEWKGLQALFLKDYPCAYYIHCMAHRLQLALVAAAREVSFVHEFFQNLSFFVNAVGASCKCQDELQAAQAAEIAELLIATLKRDGDTR
ncbi:uncharacterized protein LOC111891496 [Lactuca sativa]|uniref:uncharacterized protein LOC111891496 n=1 Tax=Lactuca sativa TaxID=4236 RepID=UPI000CD9F957|nr:uncharacterized protein LOC111891496 [Lactuca sativa]